MIEIDPSLPFQKSETGAHLSINDLINLLDALGVRWFENNEFDEIEAAWLRWWRYNNTDLMKDDIDWSRYRFHP